VNPGAREKITDEMIEAGCEALESFFSFDIDNPKKIACAVYRAMHECEEEEVE
jgi:hypothetical protein